MFVTGNRVIKYPSKSIVMDLLSRSGLPDKYSFTPWSGCADILHKQFENSCTDVVVTAEDIWESQNGVDFSADKSRADDSGVNRDISAYEIKDYYRMIEDIDEEWARKYIENIIIGYKSHNNGIIARRKDEQVINKVYDDETGDFIDVSDLIEKEKDFSTEEIISAKKKLPYLLKQLQMGSIEMRGSLLSFIIAAEKFFSNHENEEFRPRHAISLGVYRMNKWGEINGRFVDTDNSGEPFRTLFRWVCGRVETDSERLYYSTYQELLRVLNVLDIDITQEDPTEYQADFIDKAVCTYLASNEEFIEEYGTFLDNKVYGVLTPENIGKIARSMSNERDLLQRSTRASFIESIAVNLRTVMQRDNEKWRENTRLVTKFMMLYMEKCRSEKYNPKKYTFENGILFNTENNAYELIDLKPITDVARQEALVSIAGKLVRVPGVNEKGYVEVLDMNNAIDVITRNYKGSWRYVYF